MAFSHGRTAVLKVSDSTSTLRDVSTYINQSGLDRTADLVDVTAFQATSKAFIAGFKDGKFTLSGFWDPTVDGYLSGIYGGTADDFEYYPAGTASGNVKYSGSAICLTYNEASDIADANKISAEFQVVGDVTRAVI